MQEREPNFADKQKNFAQKFVDTRAAICYLGKNSHA